MLPNIIRKTNILVRPDKQIAEWKNEADRTHRSNFQAMDDIDPFCENCHAKDCKLRKCARCRSVHYCSVPCQKRHWKKIHRYVCSKSTKELAEQARPAIHLDSTNEKEIIDQLFQQVKTLSIEEAHHKLEETKTRLEEIKQALKEHEVEDISRYSNLTAARAKGLMANDERPLSTETSTSSGNQSLVKTVKISKLKADHTDKTVVPFISDLNIFPETFTINGFRSSNKWRYMVENLGTLSRYNVFITPREYDSYHLDQFCIPGLQELHLLVSSARADENNPTHTAVALVNHIHREQVVKFYVPGILALPQEKEEYMEERKEEIFYVANSALITADKDSIILCLPYQSDGSTGESPDLIGTSTQIKIDRLNYVACGACGNSLLHKEGLSPTQNRIKKVLPLPTGYWDEITDYLSCYEGVGTLPHRSRAEETQGNWIKFIVVFTNRLFVQFLQDPIISLSSSSTHAKTGVVFEDGCSYLMHKDDLAESVSVLEIDGYGREPRTDLVEPESTQVHDEILQEQDALEELIQMETDWRDLIGGSTLCCNSCQSILGCAAVENTNNLRLYKHRLAHREPTNGRLKKGDFVGDERRTFTCATFLAHEMVRYAESKAVFNFAVISLHPKLQGSRTKKVLHIRLVSWSSTAALCDRGEHFFHLDEAIKVIFEELEYSQWVAFESGNPDDMPFSFLSKLDLCCYPEEQNSNGSQTTLKPRTLRIHLEYQDWDVLRQTLRTNADFFPESISHATIKMKLGRHSSKTRLSILQRY